jgi:hypothetical protein
MSRAAELYNQDFFLWTQEQAHALREAARARANLPLDWENLAEEVESLGTSQRRELRNRIANIIEHLLKLEYSPALEPLRGWTDTITRERREIELLLDDSPSLRRELPAIVADAVRRTVKLIAEDLTEWGELDRAEREQLKGAHYEPAQVLDSGWLPQRRVR